MKLGVSYNIFDGQELLKGSIEQIRPYVDYISVVYQEVSNMGDLCDSNLLGTLEALKSEGLVDELYLYNPQETGPHINEITKRNIGLDLSRLNGCTHHMSMDADEYYDSKQFLELKLKVIRGNYDSSFCKMKTYYKSWEYVLDPPEEYYVSLIFKIKKGLHYGIMAPSPVLVDPTRRMNGILKPLVLDRKTIEMHHGSYIRNDIRKKLINSSASSNFKNDINKIAEHFDKWEYPEQVIWGGSPIKHLNVKKITPLFNYER